jgi:iron complex outermembrane receptor protein
MKKLTLLCASTALLMPATVFAQSTGSQEVENEEEIVVTGTRNQDGVEGIVVPDSTKARAVITQELIEHQAPGQSILQTINLVPGVNFTNNDPYGSSGGNIRIRGFDGNRISLTFDGLPLNDTGNYAIYSNQQLDPELIEQVNVNLGTTDVDSPTASAAGGTVNYRTRLPGRTLGTRGTVSLGEDGYHRVFGMFDTGEIFDLGPRAFISASTARNDKFRGPGKIYKQQYNARIYYPMGDDGDFLSVSGHYNQNRNNFYRNPGVADLRTLLGTTVVPGPTAFSPDNPLVVGGYSSAQNDLVFNFENLPRCVRDAPTPGVRDNDAAGSSADPNAPASCTSFFELRVNPSNTGNIRGQSRFSLSDNLVLTIDPSFQYTLANGGGTSVLNENAQQLGGNNSTSAPTGVDLNGDGDLRDNVRIYSPNNTNTHRYGLTSSLIWDVARDHRFRVAYTFDRGRHRQTGEYGFLDPGGRPENVFGGRNGEPIRGLAGNVLQGRDRLSIASLHQVAGQYIGRFLERKLRVELGLRAPFFKRELTQNCFTNQGGSSVTVGGIGVGGGFTLCAPLTSAQAKALSPNFVDPFKQTYKFDKLLPNLGATYNFDNGLSVFGSFAKGFSAPRTDNLYRRTLVDIQPESTNSFDLGVRYTLRDVQAQLTGWKIDYSNRIISTFDPDLGIALDRNVGKVKSYGFDGSIAIKPIRPLTLYALASYIDAEFQENVEIGKVGTTVVFAPTKGKMVAETPEWQFGGRVQLDVGPVTLGAQGKWVDDRFATDVNDVLVKGYTVVDLDARLSLRSVGLDRTYLQLNVINLFDKFYFGGINSQIAASTIGGVSGSNPSFTVGSPRTILGSINFGF